MDELSGQLEGLGLATDANTHDRGENENRTNDANSPHLTPSQGLEMLEVGSEIFQNFSKSLAGPGVAERLVDMFIYVRASLVGTNAGEVEAEGAGQTETVVMSRDGDEEDSIVRSSDGDPSQSPEQDPDPDNDAIYAPKTTTTVTTSVETRVTKLIAKGGKHCVCGGTTRLMSVTKIKTLSHAEMRLKEQREAEERERRRLGG